MPPAFLPARAGSPLARAGSLPSRRVLHMGSPVSSSRTVARLRPGDRTIVCGAGPAGLTAAYLLAKQGHPVTVLESDDVVGGISRTAQYKGFRFDIGGHRFFTKIRPVEELWEELSDKAETRPEGSATVRALDAGVHAIGKKVVEEAAEVWMAAEHEGEVRTAEEISQLLYRVQVLMLARGLSLEDVYAHL